MAQTSLSSEGIQNPTIGPTVKLRIMATTDLHAQIFPYDYYSDQNNDAVGLARTATLVRFARAETGNSVLLDNGDFLQGNPLADYVALECGLQNGKAHPVIAAMNALGYDAATLGNHEFDYGVDFLMRALDGANFPMISANILTKKGADVASDKTLVSPYVLLDKAVTDENGQHHNLRIGLIGFAPPLAMLWDVKSRNSSLFTRDIVQSARALVPEMKRRGADIIIALCHSGIHAAPGSVCLENASAQIATVDGIDAIIAGHTHEVFPGEHHVSQSGIDAALGKLHDTPTVMAGSLGTHLGLIDLVLQRHNTRWQVQKSRVQTRPISKNNNTGGTIALVGNDPDVVRAAAKGHAKTLDYIHQPIGKTSGPLHSYFSQITTDTTMSLVTGAQRHFARRALAASDYSHLPILSAASPVKVGGRGGARNYVDIAAGGLAIRHIADLYYYPDIFTIVKITGQELRQWLERSCGAFNQIHPNTRNDMLLNPDFPCYFFDVIKGVTYQIDISKPARYDPAGRLLNAGSARIVDLSYEGRAVTDTMEFAVATNSYRASGGGNFCGATRGNVIYEARETNRDVIREYIAREKAVFPTAVPIWTFSALPDTSALFETALAARSRLGDAHGVRLRDTGITRDGFAQIRIDF